MQFFLIKFDFSTEIESVNMALSDVQKQLGLLNYQIGPTPRQRRY